MTNSTKRSQKKNQDNDYTCGVCFELNFHIEKKKEIVSLVCNVCHTKYKIIPKPKQFKLIFTGIKPKEEALIQ